MSTSWTPEQILALAPDASSAKSGRDLASPRKWVTLGQNDQALWGECQGSGKSPYQTQIELAEPAFRCTCPSRKFPCKHGLGLFLLAANQPGAFSQKEPPGWVTEWLSSRAAKAEKQAEKAAQQEEKAATVDPAAQAKRAAQREKKVAAGLADLEVWLKDLVRGGLAAAQSQPYGFWDTPAKRLVDAQASGVARLLRDLAGIPSSGSGWQERLLERLSRIHLLLEGYKRLESLPPETQADLRSLIGWNLSQEELLAETGVRDRWVVLGQRVEEEERFKTQRTWLWGRETGRAALVLSFAAFGQHLDRSLLPGACVDAELVFFPSAYPLRSLVKTRHESCEPPESVPGYSTLAGAFAAYGDALARNPWLEQFPLPLQEAIPVRNNGGWAVRDAEDRLVPFIPRLDQGWRLAALSGGHPLVLFGEWSGDHLMPLSVWVEGRFHPVSAAAIE